MNIRKMTRSDIPAALKIDAAAFEKPWTDKAFADELEKAYACYILLENNGVAAGYAGIWCIYETAELIRIAVEPHSQRKGFADAMMRELLETAARSGCEQMLLEVRGANAPAQKLYTKHGFHQSGIRRGYYDGEDAVIMEKQL